MSALLLAIACGVCLEDKVAATYDHALVARALAQHRVVVFAEPRSAVDERRLKAFAAAAARAPGVESATVKTSAAPASVSSCSTRAAPTRRRPSPLCSSTC